jgi:hypothetical protein
MALSGSNDFSLTAREVIAFALRKCNIVGFGEDPSAEAAEDARITLNLMLKDWSIKGPHLWKKTEGAITMTAATASYDLSATLNPIRILSLRYRDINAIDLPMMPMVREEYFDLPQKTSSGIPTTWYFDPQRSAPTLYVWPVKTGVTSETLRATYQKRFDDIDALDDDIDIVQEWLLTIGYNLASLLLDDYPVEGKESDRIIARAEMLHGQAMDFDREDSVVFCPGEY